MPAASQALGTSGTLSYVVVLANANTNPAGSQITFDPTEFSTPQTITLASTLVLSEASGAEVIDASNVSPVTISGTDVAGSPVIQVDPGLTATLKDLRIINGSGSGEGGGIGNAGTLTLSAVNLVDDKASRGGAIENAGDLIVSSGCSFESNSGSESGGAIYQSGGAVTITDSTLADNKSTNGGAVYVAGGSLTIHGGTLTGNSASTMAVPLMTMAAP